jgi:hypothetical protein
MILYGQTSSGKTFTLFGDKDEKPFFNKNMRGFSKSEDEHKQFNKTKTNLYSDRYQKSFKKSETKKFMRNFKNPMSSKSDNKVEKKLSKKETSKLGIIPRYLHSLFEKIRAIKRKEKVKFTFEYSFFEIYREKIYDLLNQTFEEVNDERGNINKILKSLNLREKSNKKVLIGMTLKFFLI